MLVDRLLHSTMLTHPCQLSKYDTFQRQTKLPVLLLTAFVLGIWTSCATAAEPFNDFVKVPIVDEAGLHKVVEQAANSNLHGIYVILPTDTIVLTRALTLPAGASVVLHGSLSLDADLGTTPASALACDEARNTSLIQISGNSTLVVTGVAFHSCVRPAILVEPGSSADIFIENAIFKNFSRTLEPGRVDICSPDTPARISASTAALAIHADNFTGTLVIRNSTFRDNYFTTSVASGACQITPLLSATAAVHRGQRRALMQYGDGPEDRDRAPAGADSSWTAAGYSTRPRPGFATTAGEASSGYSPGPQQDGRPGQAQHGVSDLPRRQGAGRKDRQTGPWRSRRRLQQYPDLPNFDESGELLLSYAARLDPGAAEEGPWADDMEAVVAVTCGDGSTVVGKRPKFSCSVSLQGVKLINNTGVATSGLYVLCDGARCNVSLTDCTVRDNKLLWQGAIDPVNLPPPGPTGDISRPKNGLLLFQAMMPWLTYTYPIFYHWMSDSTHVYDSMGLGSMAYSRFLSVDSSSNSFNEEAETSLLPAMTGRTLGAVVMHQRNAPNPGAEATTPAMVNVKIEGGEYSGNDGAAIMSTATDWSRMAGGYGTWSTSSPMRHSADISLSGLRVDGHTSGMPAIWLRWARNVNVVDVHVSNSTGAIWMDEVRDSATVDSSRITDNVMPEQRWLYYGAFLSFAPQESPPVSYPWDLGAGSFHAVLVQMTALGSTRENAVTVTDTVFEGNPSFMTGALYIVGSDRGVLDKNNLPGRTKVAITGTTFRRNRCRRGTAPNSCDEAASGDGTPMPQCPTAERPLYAFQVYGISISQSRFEGNGNGGVYVQLCTGLVVTDTLFVGNVQSYDYKDSSVDKGIGGGGLTALYIGDNGVNIVNCTFVNNTAPSGGGVIVREFFSAIFLNSSFTDNKATNSDGGGLLLMQSEAKDTDSVRPGYDRVILCTFANNTSGRRGGAVAAIKVATESTWWILNSRFVQNQAMIYPAANLNSPLSKPDQAGGGAIYVEKVATMVVSQSTFLQNRVLRHAGGALRVVDSEGLLRLRSSTFINNAAIMGGAVAASRVAGVEVTDYVNGNNEPCRFINNSVTDPWVWPDTSPVPQAMNDTMHLPLDAINPGYGGGLYVSNGDYATVKGLSILNAAIFEHNTALIGGAIAHIAGSSLDIESPPRTASWYNFTLPTELSTVAHGVPNTTIMFGDNPNDLVVPYNILFASNSALLGGAMYIRNIVNVKINSSLGQISYGSQGNDAYFLGGSTPPSAAYPEDDGGLLFGDGSDDGIFIKVPETWLPTGQPAVVYYNNTAAGGGALYLDGSSQVTFNSVLFVANSARRSKVSGGPLGTQDAQRAANSDQPCSDGSGGAVCIVGKAGSATQMSASDLLFNSAESDGGGLYVADGRGCSSPTSCFTVALTNVTVSGNVALEGRGAGVFWTNEGTFYVNSCVSDSLQPLPAEQASLYENDTSVLLRPRRKAPAPWFQNLSWDRKTAMLQPVGGPTNGTRSGVASGASYTSTNLTTVLTVVNDTWLGMPYHQLPCSDWGYNAAAAGGGDIGSTPYFLLVKPYENFYSSNTDMHLQVTVHDWFGYNSTENTTSRTTILVRAESPMVLGTSEAVAAEGVANFNDLRLRAPKGVWEVSFKGRMSYPERDLQSASLLVDVRPCGINEYLMPESLDECIKCKTGFYNVNSTSDTCMLCPDNAECGYPGDGVGFMVPHDGTWHNHFFSTQVLECPNEEACKTPNRSDALTQLQLQVWQVSRWVQMSESSLTENASYTVNSTAAAVATVSSQRRRFLQVWEYWEPSDNKNTTFLLELYQATMSLVPKYMATQCSEGYTGIMCGQCAPDYGWVKSATCIRCPRSKGLSGLYYTLATMMTMVSLAITIKVSLGPSREQQHHVAGLQEQQQHHVDGLQEQQQHHHQHQHHHHHHHHQQQDEGISPSIPEAASVPLPTLSPRRDSPPAVPGGSSTAAEKRTSGPGTAGSSKTYSTPSRFHRDNTTGAPIHTSISGAVRTCPSRSMQTPFAASQNAPSLKLTDSGEDFQVRALVELPVPEVVVELSPMSVFASDIKEGLVIACDEKDGCRGSQHSHAATRPRGAQSSVSSQEPRLAGGHERNHQGCEQEPSECSDTLQNLVQVSTVFRIAISYLQVLALLDDVQLSLSTAIDVFLGICRQATSYPGTLVSLDCSLPSTFHESKAIARVLVAVLAPVYTSIAFIILSVAASILEYGVKRFRGTLKPGVAAGGVAYYALRQLNRQLLVALSTIMFFFYPSMSQTLFSIFYCYDVSLWDASSNTVATKRVWRQDFNMQCYQREHLALAMGLGIPGLLLVGLGWPIINAVFVARRLHRASDCLTIRSASGGPQQQQNSEVVSDYKPRWIGWESVILLRQLAIAAVVTFSSTRTAASVQLLIVFFLLAAGVAVQTLARPYLSPFMGKVALMASYGLMATIYLLVILSQLDKDDGAGRALVSTIVMTINALVLLVLTWSALQTYWTRLLHLPGLRMLDPATRRSLTFSEARSRILTHMSSNLGTGTAGAPRPCNTPMERLTQMRDNSLATSRAAVVVLGNSLSGPINSILTKVRSSSHRPSGSVEEPRLRNSTPGAIE